MNQTKKMNEKQKHKKGQIMLEMLIVVSFLLLILIPTLIYILSVLSSESWKSDSNQAYATLSKIVSISTKLVVLGNGSSTSESVFLPSSVKSINVTGNGEELFITLIGPQAMAMDIVVYSPVKIKLNSSQDWSNVKGAQMFHFVVQNGEVLISKQY